jgi:hypothetical protein
VDEDADEYSSRYRVYRMPAAFEPADGDAWIDVPRHGTLVGEINTVDVRFDDTRRHAVDDSIFTFLG